MWQKQADSVGSATPDPSVSSAAASAVPPVQISNKPPPGQQGPRGIQPRQTYSRVNTGTPPTPDAGASVQKSMGLRGLEFLPKLSEANMSTQVTAKPTINEMLKAAMDGTLSKLDVTAEAARQLGGVVEKTASAASDSIPTDVLHKLAAALGYVADQLEKGAAIELPGAAHGEPAPGTGPGALKVMKAETDGKNPSQPGNSGGHPVVATGTEKGKATAPDNAMKTNEDMHHGKQPVHPLGKSAEASTKLASSNLAKLSELTGIKIAEDATNPAHISAGPAVPPEATESGEKTPAGPHGSTGLVSSNKSAIDYTKHDAKSEPISEVAHLFTATPMKDPVLSQIFDHSGQAGVKTSAALDMTKVSAARALLSKVAAEVSAKAKKEKDSNMGGGAPPPPGVPSPAFTQ